MCGIAGMVPLRPVPSSVPLRMREVLAPRGPDDAGLLLIGPDGRPVAVAAPTEGTWARPFVLHRRLAILDPSPAGHQPMSSPDGRHHIVYNGEVYNFKELRAELEALGHTFATGTDTEVVLAAYAEWQEAMLPRLVGMFAFAILDVERGRCFLARDPFGIKPLFYAAGPWGFAFASDVPTLLEVPGLPRTADLQTVYRYLASPSGLGATGAATSFRHIRQVPAGHHLTVDLASAAHDAPVTWWTARAETTVRVPYAEAVAEVRARFLESVRLHLRSDVPVGAALSGGIDSSAIVAAMRHHLGPEAAVHTFSYLAEDDDLNEGEWVRIVAAAKDTRMHTVQPDPAALRVDLPRLIAAQGEPFGGTSIYAQYRVFQAARAAGVKVMLDGQGADEILAGYRTFLPPRLATLLRRGRLLRARRLHARMAALPGVHGPTLARAAIGHALPARLLRGLRRVRPARTTAAAHGLDAAWFRARGVVTEPPEDRPPHDLKAALLRSLQEDSLPNLLRYEDRNSMAHSVESRVPFLDHRFVAYVLALPEEYLIGPDGTTKRVFRDAMRGLVPDAVLDRRDKIGFRTTERDWLLGVADWVAATLDSAETAGVPFLDRAAMRAEWDAIRAGTQRDTRRLWRWLNLLEWTRLFAVRYDDAEGHPDAAARPLPPALARLDAPASASGLAVE